MWGNLFRWLHCNILSSAHQTKIFWSMLFISFHNASLWGRPDFSLEWVNIISSEKPACFFLQIENLINIVSPHLLLESLELNPWATPPKEINSSQCIFSMMFTLLISASFIFPLIYFLPFCNLLYLLFDCNSWCMYYLSSNRVAYIDKYTNTSVSQCKRMIFLLRTLSFIISLSIPLTNAPFINRKMVSFSPLNLLSFQIKVQIKVLHLLGKLSYTYFKCMVEIS